MNTTNSSSQTSNDLSHRVDQLEHDIKEIKELLKAQTNPPISEPVLVQETVTVTPESVQHTTPAPVKRAASETINQPVAELITEPVTTAPKKQWIRFDQGSEWWLNKVGIGLLLLGLAFLFRYSVEQGWLTEGIRTGFGVLLGAVLLAFGLKTHRKKPYFAQVLFGGAIASWYITIFAAFNFYDLITYWPAVGLMVVVTLLGYGMATKYNSQMLALIAVVGGLATPFILFSNESDVRRLFLYITFISITALLLYGFKGWRTLLWVTGMGTGLVATIAMIGAYNTDQIEALDVQIILQVCVALIFISFAVIPLIRRLMGKAYTSISWLPDSINTVLEHHIHLVVVANMLHGFILTMAIWDDQLTDTSSGVIVLGFAIFYGLLSWIAWKQLVHNLVHTVYGRTNYAIAIILGALSVLFLFEGNYALIAYSLFTIITLAIGYRLKCLTTQILIHVLHLPLLLWLLVRVMEGPDLLVEYPLLHWDAPVMAISIATLFVAMWLVRPKPVQHIYMVMAHGITLLWLTSELSVFDDVFNYVVLLWVAYAVAMHVVSYWRSNPVGKYFAHGVFSIIALLSLALVVGLGEHSLIIANVDAVIMLLVIAGWFSSSKLLGRSKYVYQIIGHQLLMLFAFFELSSITNDGSAYVTVAWGLHGMAMLVYGLVKNHQLYRWFGMIIIMVMLAKLFLVDLGQVDTIWRVLLFMGFGGLFLVVSFFTQKLVKPTTPEKAPTS